MAGLAGQKFAKFGITGVSGGIGTTEIDVKEEVISFSLDSSAVVIDDTSADDEDQRAAFGGRATTGTLVVRKTDGAAEAFRVLEGAYDGEVIGFDVDYASALTGVDMAMNMIITGMSMPYGRDGNQAVTFQLAISDGSIPVLS